MRKLNGINGFTLIELLVVATITIILSGSAIAGYYRFTQKQSLLNDARNLVTEIRKVQSMAKDQVYPDGCGSNLTSYQLASVCSGSSDCQSVKVKAVCAGTDITVTNSELVLAKTYFSTAMVIDFVVGTGQIKSAGTYSLAYPGGTPYAISVVTHTNGNVEVKEQ